MVLRQLIFTSLVLFITACGGGNLGPSDEIATQAISDLVAAKSDGEIDDFVAVDDFELLSEENTASKVNPRIEARFVASLSFKEDLYATSETLSDTSPDDTVVVEIAYNAGDAHKISGTYEARIRSQTDEGTVWDLDVELDEELTQAIPGKTLDTFKNAVIKDSSEHDAVLQRIALREEQERIAQEKRDRFLSELRGRWITSGSIMQEGRPFVDSTDFLNRSFSCDKPLGAGLELRVPNINGEKVSVPSRSFWISDPSTDDDFTTTITILEDGESFRVFKEAFDGVITCQVPGRGRRVRLFPATALAFTGRIQNGKMYLTDTGYLGLSAVLEKQ